jgi:hypothetical protein
LLDRSTRSVRAGTAARRPSRFALAALVLAVPLLSAACIRTEISIEVNEDGSGSVAFLVAFDRQMMAALQAFGDGDAFFDADDLLAEVDLDDLPPGATVEPYEDGDFTGVRIRLPFAPGDDVAAAIDAVTADASDDGVPLGGSDEPFEHFELARDGDRWRFAATVAPASDDVLGELDEDAGDLEFARAFFGDASCHIRLRLPGEMTEHNADTVESDGTLRWELDFFAAESREIHATSDVGNGGLTILAWRDLGEGWLLVGVAAVVGLLVIVAGWLAVRRAPAADEREE